MKATVWLVSLCLAWGSAAPAAAQLRLFTAPSPRIAAIAPLLPPAVEAAVLSLPPQLPEPLPQLERLKSLAGALPRTKDEEVRRAAARIVLHFLLHPRSIDRSALRGLLSRKALDRLEAAAGRVAAAAEKDPELDLLVRRLAGEPLAARPLKREGKRAEPLGAVEAGEREPLSEPKAEGRPSPWDHERVRIDGRLERPKPEGPAEKRTPAARILRIAAVAAIVAALVVAPALLSAEPTAFLRTAAPFVDFDSPALYAATLGLAAANVALSLASAKLAPADMGRPPDEMVGVMFERPLWQVTGILAFGAALEELTFRGLAFGGAAWSLGLVLPAAPAYAAAALGSSWLFSKAHGYGMTWPRIFGGLLYAGAFAVAGTLWLPILLHFLHNWLLVLYTRLAARRPSP